MTDDTQPAYQVLARKYRPGGFDELVGQDALVRTLSNAFTTGRIAHGYMMTGVRGVGKTTTARIIAKALNCTSSDGPTMSPCGTCDDCRAIAEGSHVDVLELDAASRTKVEQMRELLDSVPYLPVQGRYKVYIIDEVHMLSNNAFNALLKTLEEPPERVVFIFATTEIRKVPVTVLSRCQRFDLKRVGAEALGGHLQRVTEAEGATVEPEAIQLIVRAAEGSVRDALSLLDQAIAHGAGTANAELVRDMLGLADGMRVLDLFADMMAGKAAEALGGLRGLYDSGADPQQVLQDLLEITHWLSAMKIAPGSEARDARPEQELNRGKELADRLSMATLSRCWSLLLKGVQEARSAPSPISAAEMTIIRLVHAADMPDPAELVKRLQSGGGAAPAGAPGGAPNAGRPAGGAPSSAPGYPPQSSGGGEPPPHMSDPGGPSGPVMSVVNGGMAPSGLAQPQVAEHDPLADAPPDFMGLVQLVKDKGEILVASNLERDVRLVSYAPGRIQLRMLESAPRNLTNKLARLLQEWFDHRWVVMVSRQDGEEPLTAQMAQQAADEMAAWRANPLVKAALETFDGAEIESIKSLEVLDAPEMAIFDDDYTNEDFEDL